MKSAVGECVQRFSELLNVKSHLCRTAARQRTPRRAHRRRNNDQIVLAHTNVRVNHLSGQTFGGGQFATGTASYLSAIPDRGLQVLYTDCTGGRHDLKNANNGTDINLLQIDGYGYSRSAMYRHFQSNEFLDRDCCLLSIGPPFSRLYIDNVQVDDSGILVYCLNSACRQSYALPALSDQSDNLSDVTNLHLYEDNELLYVWHLNRSDMYAYTITHRGMTERRGDVESIESTAN